MTALHISAKKKLIVEINDDSIPKIFQKCLTVLTLPNKKKICDKENNYPVIISMTTFISKIERQIGFMCLFFNRLSSEHWNLETLHSFNPSLYPLSSQH